jgi:hypothetical protein
VHSGESTMKVIRLVFLISLLGMGVSWLEADTVRLRNGKDMDAAFISGSARHVNLLIDAGQILKLPIDSLVSVSFSMSQAAATSSGKSSKPRTVVIPGGTAFRVRTLDPIDVDATRAGMKFRGTLDDPIMLAGDVIVPRGADVVLVAAKVDQGGRFKGSDLIELKVNSILARGRSYPVVTSLAQAKTDGEGKKTSRKVIGGTGLGAIIGGIAGGGTGAAIGAISGAAAGTAVAAAGKPHLKIAAETRLQFQLLSDWKLE